MMSKQSYFSLHAAVFLCGLAALLAFLLLLHPVSGEESNQDEGRQPSADWLAFDRETDTAPEIAIIRCDTTGMELEFTIPGLAISRMEAGEAGGEEDFQLLTIPGHGHLYETGKPQLPVMRGLFIVPSRNVELRIIAGESQTLSAFNIYPAQPFTTDHDPASAFTQDQELYATDAFYPGNQAAIASTGTLRDYRIIQLQVNPVHFNPVTGELMIYTRLRLELDFGPLFVREGAQRDTSAFDAIYQETLRNYQEAGGWTLPRVQSEGQDAEDLRDPGNRADYLIITFDSFYDATLPLADAKEERGYEPMVVNSSEIYTEFPAGGNDESIHDFITYAFDNWELPPLHVLLVGDVDQIPINTDGNPSDHYYSCVGDDDPYYPDLHLGRLSVGTVGELVLVRDKVIDYGRNPPEGDWQTEIMLAAHGKGPLASTRAARRRSGRTSSSSPPTPTSGRL